jgi:hypothetical protein
MGHKPKPKARRSQVQQLAEARRIAAERHVEQSKKNMVPQAAELGDAQRLRLLIWQQMVANARDSNDRHYAGKILVQIQHDVGLLTRWTKSVGTLPFASLRKPSCDTIISLLLLFSLSSLCS